MSEQKFHLDLTGTPLDGYQTEEVSAALARLLRIPPNHARNLLRGKPSRIKREFENEKAAHLMGKILACGAQCKMSPSENREKGGQTIQAGTDLSGKLELELEQERPEMELDQEPEHLELGLDLDLEQESEDSGMEPEQEMERSDMGLALVPVVEEAQAPPDEDHDDQIPAQSKLHAPELVSNVLPAQVGRNDQPARAKSSGSAGRDVVGAPVSSGGNRLKMLSFAAAAVVLLGIAVWAGFSFLGGSKPVPPKEVVKEAPTQGVPAEAVSELGKTQRRQELLSRSVRIWMIQYGAGFDPSQVTMERMQKDLGISPEQMRDGWGIPFRYSTTSGSYTIISAGPDRTFGSKDDLKVEKTAR